MRILNKPYVCVNYLVQGTAGGIVKEAMRRIDKLPWLDWKNIRIPLQIHDELIVEVHKRSKYNSPQYIREIMDVMEDCGKTVGVLTPVTCKRVSKDWGHGEEIDVTYEEFTTKE